MRKRTRIIQISGFRGLIMAVFVVICLTAGFVGFPALMAMQGWNYAAEIFGFPQINMLQGLMLWAIIAISGYIINEKGKYFVSLNSAKGLQEKDVRKLMQRINRQKNKQMLEQMYMKSFDMKNVEEMEKSKEKEKENV